MAVPDLDLGVLVSRLRMVSEWDDRDDSNGGGGIVRLLCGVHVHTN